MVGLYAHGDCGRHDTGWGHPEHQGRLRAVMQAVDRALPELHGRVEPMVTAPAEPAALLLAHTAEHVEAVRRACERASREGEIVSIDADTVVSGASWDAALAAAGCAIQAVDDVLSGRCRTAFCPIRPPGHHATRDRAMGFCLFNNVALAALHALEAGGLERVLIADWDVHHGNGTQAIFYEDPRVYVVSMHQHPLYPGTGSADERGRGEGEGTTLNLPMPPGLPAAEYVSAFLGALERVAKTHAPELVLVSAGFDAALEDPLGGFTLTASDFARLTRAAVEAAGAKGRVVSVLEGGYNPPELGRNVVAHIGALADAGPGPGYPDRGEP